MPTWPKTPTPRHARLQRSWHPLALAAAAAALAGCNTATIVSGTQAYATLTGTNGQRCFGAGCHNGAQRPMFTSQTTFMNAVINQSSTTGVAYITPNNPDKSYLLYKLRGLQTLIRNGAGQQMPKGGTPLTDAQFCMMYDWVLHGAPRN